MSSPYVPMANIKLADSRVTIKEVYDGDLSLISDDANRQLVSWCIHCANEYLGDVISSDNIFDIDKSYFVSQATSCKKFFTNSPQTRAILEDLILRRYCDYRAFDLFYDVPRVRIIPNSDYLKSGISYNYQPHRDTWYGGGQDEINHWISVMNVTAKSTFFIAPQFFNTNVLNSSETFDLDHWDSKYRPMASSSDNLISEQRPHPLALDSICSAARLGFPLSSGNEVCFSGHHIHGSLKNETSRVRVSIDYRVYCNVPGLDPPKSIDNKSSGNYKKYLIRHSGFGS